MGMLFDLFIDQNLKHAMYLEVHNITYAKHYMYSIQSYCLHAHIHIHNYMHTYTSIISHLPIDAEKSLLTFSNLSNGTGVGLGTNQRNL